ncbi:uncharacterized protein LODBEIA_P14890 [Lodderomyces beijingensis]|uniref:C2H2-type domain-containing protein n=1 Tax=Lodderomyces beijingensis TaxID=1775926 RepID=A0ABP0ZJ84_9ASCO
MNNIAPAAAAAAATPQHHHHQGYMAHQAASVSQFPLQPSYSCISTANSNANHQPFANQAPPALSNNTQQNIQPLPSIFVAPGQARSSQAYDQFYPAYYGCAFSINNNNNNSSSSSSSNSQAFPQQASQADYTHCSSYSYQPSLYTTATLPTQNALPSQSFSSPQRYPPSPASMSDKSSISSASSSSSSTLSIASYSQPNYLPFSHSHTNTSNIDYSSIVSYTISPSLKRKWKQRRSNVVSPATSPLDSTETFPCPQCDKVFKKPYNLKSHMKTHSVEKPFQCSHCPKSFARSHDKKRHEVLHQGVKNFKCEGYLQDGTTRWGCGKKFARSDALSRHFRTETGWLCIRPLMDEAKKLEEQGISTNLTSNGGSQQDGAGAVPVSAAVAAPSYAEYRSTADDEFYDNSHLIKRFIYNK